MASLETSDLKTLARRAVDRRSFLGIAGAFGATLVLASCSTGAGAASSGVFTAKQIAKVLPNYYPVTYATPDFPSVKGSTMGYLKVPSPLVRSVKSKPGSGGVYTAMSPAWWTVPDAGNDYAKAINKALGSTVTFQASDGNSYGAKIQAVLASPSNIPDLTVIPGWNLPPKFDAAVQSLFADLTPYLAGDKIKDYPNLANLPTDAWKYSVFAGKLYGLPYPGEVIQNTFMYRKDLFDKLGLETPTNADNFVDILAKATNASANRWGCEDLWNSAQIMFGVPESWAMVNGKLTHAFESTQYRDALQWLRRTYASGAVHPSAMAGDTANANNRYESGQTLVKSDGTGGWAESVARVLPSNPSYNTQAMDFFAPDGGKPELFKAGPASIYSFIKKSESPARIRELLKIANFCAAPFGTTEYELINYGVKDVDFTLDADGAEVLTKKGSGEVTSTFGFIVHPAMAMTQVAYPKLIKDYCAWSKRMCAFATEPLLYGIQIQSPAKYASLGSPFDDLKADIANGRKPLSALDGAIATWRKNGGDELRKFYQKYVDASK